MATVQLIWILAGIIVILVVLSALMNWGRRRGAKRVHEIRQAAEGDAAAEDPKEDRRDP
jgi:uncharacterized iron-regulated membrane protein